MPSPVISKARAAAESAGRTFLEAAAPAFIAAVSVSRPDGITIKDFVVAALISAGAAGIAAVARVAKPIQTDAQGVGVKGVKA